MKRRKLQIELAVPVTDAEAKTTRIVDPGEYTSGTYYDENNEKRCYIVYRCLYGKREEVNCDGSSGDCSLGQGADGQYIGTVCEGTLHACETMYPSGSGTGKPKVDACYGAFENAICEFTFNGHKQYGRCLMDTAIDTNRLTCSDLN